ncbi:putative bifunctional diguanylate cyclase/phosphodiesterase [Niveispirillum lacus]|nr:EAL domain-containing protein [Niveispirillum lacus]
MQRMLDQFSLRQRLLASFAFLLVLMVAISVVSLQRLNALTVGIDHLSGQEARVALLAQQANQHTQSAAHHLLRLLQTPDRSERAPLYSSMDAALAQSGAAMAELTRSGFGEAATGSEALTRLLKVRQAFDDTFMETVDLIEVQGLTAARQHFARETDPLMADLISTASALAEERQIQVQIEAEMLKADADRARLIILVLGPAALLIGGGLAAAIARSIAQPIQEAALVAGSIADGHYSCKVPAGRGPELGALMRSLATMRDSIASREKRILDLAYLDVLTDLPNRTHLVETITRVVAETSGALLLLNINRFAPINNALGFHVGDRLLREVAERLRVHVSDRYMVARLGGDEFALLIPGIGEEEAQAQAQRLVSLMRMPLSLEDQRLDVDIRLGIVMFPRDGTSAADLLRRADLALALASRRHNGFAFGSEVADQPRHEHLTLIGDMRTAMAENEFVPFFQPKLELVSGQIVGAEALLRWQHPTRGLVPPGTFIPFAEQTGFIREITPWLLATIIQQSAEWHRAGLSLVTSINISTLDLTGRQLVIETGRLLREHGLPPDLICLEITESALMDDPEVALRHLGELAALGVKLSIDDYGSGQASLGYVQRLPVHELKIDRAFVDKVDCRGKSAAIIRSTILLCEELGLSVVAEGVETDAELDWLKRNRCGLVQGYRIAKPMPAAMFRQWLADRP